jgi:Zn-dependent M28 family amino/carboxypeptidase
MCAPPATRESVLGILQGAHPERLIIVGAHYDSRSTERNDGAMDAPGANDSGSQTALLLEIARALAGKKFDATIAFAAFAGEEQGLLGSTSVSKHLAALFPGAKLEAMLDCDIVGGDKAANDAVALQQFRLYSPGVPRETGADTPDGTADNSSPSRLLMRYVGMAAKTYSADMTMIPKLREDRPGRGSDHKPFIDLGLPGVRFIETNETLAHQHSPDDTIANMTPAYTTRMARVVAATTASLARAPKAPAIVANGSAKSIALDWVSGPADHFTIHVRAVTSVVTSETKRIDGSLREVTIQPNVGGPVFVTIAANDAAGHESMLAPEWRCEGTCVGPSTNVTAKR